MPEFERAKAVHVSDRTATVIGAVWDHILDFSGRDDLRKS
jgi:hypothetical protein